MRRQGRQHGLVRTYRILPPPLNPRLVNSLTSPQTGELFTKHTKAYRKVWPGQVHWVRSNDIASSSYKLLTWRIKAGPGPVLNLPGFSSGPDLDGYLRPDMIVCFDVRSEEFKFIDTERFCNICTKLVNYKGKLGAINHDSGMRNRKLRMWVLEDVEKQGWSKFVYTLPENEVVDSCDLSVAGVTASGEIVLCKEFTSKPFYVFYFNPERNTLQCVEIHQVLENQSRVFAFVVHVEDLKFDLTRAATSINPPEQTSRSTSKSKLKVSANWCNLFSQKRSCRCRPICPVMVKSAKVKKVMMMKT